MRYDNEKDMMLMVDDAVEFLMSETKRLIEQYYDPDDRNAYILVSQNLAFSLILNLMNELHLRQELFMRSFEKQGQGGNHLPINGPDFFKGAEP